MKRFIVTVLLICLYSCNKTQSEQELNKLKKANKCFSIQNGYADFIYSDSIIHPTKRPQDKSDWETKERKYYK